MSAMSGAKTVPEVVISETHPRILSENALYVFIGAVLLVCLQFQTLPLRIEVQTLPLTAIFAILFFPFVLQRIPKSPLLVWVFVFFGYVLFHSLVLLIIDLILKQPERRFIAWFRQSFALASGVIMFLVFRTAFVHMSLKKISRWIILGALPPMILSVINIFWGIAGSGWAGAIVQGVRDFVSPEGYTSPVRASGFATEPAAWSTSLVITVLPVILFYLGDRRRKASAILFLILWGIVFAWTFSSTGILLLMIILVGGTILGPKRKVMSAFILVSFALLLSSIVIIPNNQVLRHVRSLAMGQENLSIDDRYYSIMGPFIESMSSYSMVGYGLGGVSTHYRDIVPLRVQKEIFATKWKDFPNLTILFGRLFAETGAVGLVLFLGVLAVTLWELRTLLRKNKDPQIQYKNAIMQLVWLAVCASTIIALGPYQTPHLWLWMAFIDSRFVLNNSFHES